MDTIEDQINKIINKKNKKMVYYYEIDELYEKLDVDELSKLIDNLKKKRQEYLDSIKKIKNKTSLEIKKKKLFNE